MIEVYAYDDHNFQEDMFLSDSILTPEQLYCGICDASNVFIGEVRGVDVLLELMRTRGIADGSSDYCHLIEEYLRLSGKTLSDAELIAYVAAVTRYWLNCSDPTPHKPEAQDLIKQLHQITESRT